MILKKRRKPKFRIFQLVQKKTPSPKNPMVYPFYTERRNVSRPVQRCVPGMLRLWNDPRPYRHIYTYLDPCMLPIFCQYETTILHVLVNTRKILDLIFDDHLTSHHSRTYQAKFEWVGRIISAKHREWSGVRPIEKPSSFAKFLILGWIFAKSRNNPIWNHAHTIYGTGIFTYMFWLIFMVFM